MIQLALKCKMNVIRIFSHFSCLFLRCKIMSLHNFLSYGFLDKCWLHFIARVLQPIRTISLRILIAIFIWIPWLQYPVSVIFSRFPFLVVYFRYFTRFSEYNYNFRFSSYFLLKFQEFLSIIVSDFFFGRNTYLPLNNCSSILKRLYRIHRPVED